LAVTVSANVVLAQKNTYKFDFGAGKEVKGFTRVSSQDTYSGETGFGFGFGSRVQDIDLGGGGRL
jgi:hypothetical protein